MKSLLFFTLFCSILYGQNNLDYYISNAVRNDTLLNALRNEVSLNSLQKELDRAQNSGLQISLNGAYLFSPYFNNSSGLISVNPDPNAIGYDISITNGGLYSATIDFKKNILNGALIDAVQNRNELSLKSTLNEINVAEHNLRKSITDQYLNSYQNLLLYQLTKENTANLSEQLKITEGLVEKGLVKAQDYLLLKIEYKNQLSQQNELWRNYRYGILQLKSMSGIHDTAGVILDSVNLELLQPVEHSNFTNRYSIDSLGLLNQRQLLETKYYPQLNIFFNTGLEAVELKNIQRKFGLSAGLNFSIPLYDGNQKSLTLQQYYITGKLMQSNRDYFDKNIRLQRESALEKVRSVKESLQNLQDQIEDYNQVISLSKKQVQQGAMTMIEYLTILKNFIELQKNRIATEINYQLEINNYNYWNW